MTCSVSLKTKGDVGSIDFGTVCLGEVATRTVIIKNPSKTAASVGIVGESRLSHAGLNFSEPGPFCIPPCGMMEIKLCWTPKSFGVLQHILHLHWKERAAIELTVSGSVSRPVSRRAESAVAQFCQKWAPREPTPAPRQAPLSPLNINLHGNLGRLSQGRVSEGGGAAQLGSFNAVVEGGLSRLLTWTLTGPPPFGQPAADVLSQLRLFSKAKALLAKTRLDCCEALHLIRMVELRQPLSSLEVLSVLRQGYDEGWLQLTARAVTRRPPLQPLNVDDTLLTFLEDALGPFNSRLAVVAGVLTLVCFLDRARAAELLPRRPRLFLVSSPWKSSQSLLRRCLEALVVDPEGAFGRLHHVAVLGLEWEQSPVYEIDFQVRELGVDLKDALRLCRAIELWANLKILRDAALTVPEGEDGNARRAACWGNWLRCSIAVRASLGLDLCQKSEWLNSAALGDKHVLSHFVWLLALHFVIPTAAPVDVVQRVTQGVLALASPEKAAAASELPISFFVAESVQWLLQWVCSVAQAHFGVPVSNLGSSLADGRALCLLVAMYCPEVLPIGEIREPEKPAPEEATVMESPPGRSSSCWAA
eukprot:RCo044488